jgi:putative hemolysin
MLFGTTSVVFLALCGAASFFFALSEAALFALGNWQIRLLSEKGARSARVAELMASRDDLLATIVLGNTLANAGIVAIGLGNVMHGIWPMDVRIGSILLLALILFGCEVFPKILAVRVPEFWAVRIAQPMLLLVRGTRPLRQIAQAINAWLMRVLVPKSIPPPPALTEAEYRELLELGFQAGSLKKTEKEIIHEILRLDGRTVKEVMRPRSRVAMISDDLSQAEMMKASRRYKHQRLPMHDEATDTIVGVLNTRLLLSDPGVGLDEVIEFPSFVPESMNLFQLLRSLRKQQRGLAIVMDEFGGLAGIVTVEDILESVLGRIRGEGEAQEFVMEKKGETQWRVSGLMRLDDFAREYPALGEIPEVETMGGLLSSQLGAIPRRGESVVLRGLRLTASVVDERRVQELMVEQVRKP